MRHCLSDVTVDLLSSLWWIVAMLHCICNVRMQSTQYEDGEPQWPMGVACSDAPPAVWRPLPHGPQRTAGGYEDVWLTCSRPRLCILISNPDHLHAEFTVIILLLEKAHPTVLEAHMGRGTASLGIACKCASPSSFSSWPAGCPESK